MVKPILSGVLLLASFLILSGCNDDAVGNYKLQGTWIEQTDQSDTLTFDYEKQYFTLARGLESREGHMLPKKGAGYYEYHLERDSIALYNSLSNCYCFNAYFFQFQNGAIKMGDFYNKHTPSQGNLTFIKLE